MLRSVLSEDAAGDDGGEAVIHLAILIVAFCIVSGAVLTVLIFALWVLAAILVAIESTARHAKLILRRLFIKRA
jgi:hypothetical protein